MQATSPGIVHLELLTDYPTIGQVCGCIPYEDDNELRRQRNLLIRLCEELIEQEPPDADLGWYGKRLKEIVNAEPSGTEGA
jgi:hypothetical protein